MQLSIQIPSKESKNLKAEIMTVYDAKEILEAIKQLKILLTKGQDFECAAIMRDMEKVYMDKKVEIEPNK